MEPLYLIKFTNADTLMITATDYARLAERAGRFVTVQPVNPKRVPRGKPFDINPDNVVWAQKLDG